MRTVQRKLWLSRSSRPRPVFHLVDASPQIEMKRKGHPRSQEMDLSKANLLRGAGAPIQRKAHPMAWDVSSFVKDCCPMSRFRCADIDSIGARGKAVVPPAS